MEYSEFSSLTRSTLPAVVGRIPERYREAIESTLIAGEFDFGVKHLALIVRREQVPVTAQEQQVFRRLLEYLGEPVEVADRMVVG